MKMIRAVVLRQLVLNAVQTEATIRDAIRVTSDARCTDVTRVSHVIVKRFVAQHDVAENTIAVGSFQRSDSAAVSGD